MISRRKVLAGAAASAGVLATSPIEPLANNPRVHDIAIESFRFVPNHVVVEAGDMIRWTNQDLAPHTATAEETSWDSGEIRKGASWMITVTRDMEPQYYCAFHPHMKGTFEIG